MLRRTIYILLAYILVASVFAIALVGPTHSIVTHHKERLAELDKI